MTQRKRGANNKGGVEMDKINKVLDKMVKSTSSKLDTAVYGNYKPNKDTLKLALEVYCYEKTRKERNYLL